MDNLITYLCNYALDNNIGFMLDNENMVPDEVPISNGALRLVVINNRWHRKTEISFQFAHKINRVLNGYMGKNSYSASPFIQNKNLEQIERVLQISLNIVNQTIFG